MRGGDLDTSEKVLEWARELRDFQRCSMCLQTFPDLEEIEDEQLKIAVYLARAVQAYRKAERNPPDGGSQ